MEWTWKEARRLYYGTINNLLGQSNELYENLKITGLGTEIRTRNFSNMTQISNYCTATTFGSHGIAQWYSAGLRSGCRGFESRQGLGIFLFNTASRMALKPTQPPIQWVPDSLYLWVERPGREADHSPPSSAKVKECMELYLHSPIRLHGVVIS
jgi:hypothetical protein